MLNRLRQLAASALLRASLAVHAGADRGRKNADWRARTLSADAELINDLPTLIARSRQQVRDEPLAKSAIFAYRRNVVGRGIAPVWTIKHPETGALWEEVNERLEKLFLEWASDKSAVDAEGRRTFWKIQRLAVDEKNTAGAVLFVVGYRPHPRRVGLVIQAYEAEQLDHTVQTWGGRKVRGGVEVDDFGKAVAYHLYPKPLNDYLGAATIKSERIEARRVIEHQNLDRVLQTRGRPLLAPVMQDIRSAGKYKVADLMRQVMQACLGLIIKKPPGSPNWRGAAKPGEQPEAERLENIDFTPGMVPQLPAGYEAMPFAPTQTANSFEPFMVGIQRQIAAGVNLSYGQVSRDFTKGTYSGQRQEMLEDYKVIEPEQDDLVDDVIAPVIELFTQAAILEAKVPEVTPMMFAAEPERYHDLDYTLPAKPWIDPKNEIEGWTQAIDAQLATRTEYAAAYGKRYRKIVKQTADERDLRAKAGVSIASDGAATASPAAAGGPASPSASTSPAAGTVNTEVKAEGALNGAQITAVLDVFGRLQVGQVTPAVATELIIAVGIPRDRAASMVGEQAKLPAPPAPNPTNQPPAAAAA